MLRDSDHYAGPQTWPSRRRAHRVLQILQNFSSHIIMHPMIASRSINARKTGFSLPLPVLTNTCGVLCVLCRLFATASLTFRPFSCRSFAYELECACVGPSRGVRRVRGLLPCDPAGARMGSLEEGQVGTRAHEQHGDAAELAAASQDGHWAARARPEPGYQALKATAPPCICRVVDALDLRVRRP